MTEQYLQLSRDKLGRFINGKRFPLSDEIKKKIKIKLKGNKNALGHKNTLGKHWKLSEKTIKIMSEVKKGKPQIWNREENHYLWISDRTMLTKKQERNDSAYHEWRYQVFKRDRHLCRINNKDCNEKVIAHHILGWKSHPELRYEINNGITLCLFHHPKKRVEERKLMPIFQQMNLAEVKID